MWYGGWIGGWVCKYECLWVGVGGCGCSLHMCVHVYSCVFEIKNGITCDLMVVDFVLCKRQCNNLLL